MSDSICLVESPCNDQILRVSSLQECQVHGFGSPLLLPNIVCQTGGAWEPDGWLEQMVRNIGNAGSLVPWPVSSPGAWECQECWVHWFSSPFPLLLVRKTYLFGQRTIKCVLYYNFRSYSHGVCLGVLRLILMTDFLSIQHQSQVQTCINYPLVWEKGFLFRT